MGSTDFVLKLTFHMNKTFKLDCCKHLLGRVRLGIFQNKNVFRNIFRLFCSWEQNSRNIFQNTFLCSWEQNSQNGIQLFRNENSSQTNAYLHYCNYSYSGLIPNERALSLCSYHMLMRHNFDPNM